MRRLETRPRCPPFPERRRRRAVTHATPSHSRHCSLRKECSGAELLIRPDAPRVALARAKTPESSSSACAQPMWTASRTNTAGSPRRSGRGRATREGFRVRSHMSDVASCAERVIGPEFEPSATLHVQHIGTRARAERSRRTRVQWTLKTPAQNMAASDNRRSSYSSAPSFENSPLAKSGTDALTADHSAFFTLNERAP